MCCVVLVEEEKKTRNQIMTSSCPPHALLMPCSKLLKADTIPNSFRSVAPREEPDFVPYPSMFLRSVVAVKTPKKNKRKEKEKKKAE